MPIGKRSKAAKAYDRQAVVQESIDTGSRSLAMMLMIQEVTKDEWGISGKLDCPFCGGKQTVGYSVAPRNGHIHAACKNRCFAFMQ